LDISFGINEHRYHFVNDYPKRHLVTQKLILEEKFRRAAFLKAAFLKNNPIG
jgi:hypothetical protein